MKVTVKQLKGLTFAAKGESNHWLMMDNAEEKGGSGAGSRPMELILMGLGGCTGMDVAFILKKSRVAYDYLEVELEGKQAESIPRVYEEITIRFIIGGRNIPENKVKQAIDLSAEKYCSVSKMLEKSVKINHDYRIVEEEQAQ